MNKQTPIKKGGGTKHVSRAQVAEALVAGYVLLVLVLWPYLPYVLLATTLLIGVWGAVWGWSRRTEKRKTYANGHLRELPGASKQVHAGQGHSGPAPANRPKHPGTFSELVRRKWVAPLGDFILGLDEASGDPFRMPKLTSLGVSGGQGTGKSVTMLVIMLQAIIKYAGNVRFLVVDPHMYTDSAESLVSKISPLRYFFLTLSGVAETVPLEDYEYLSLLAETGVMLEKANPTEGDDELKAWSKIVMLEMKRRLHGKKGPVWVLVIDEANTQLIYKEVSRMVEEVNRQARKVDMFVVLAGQEWKATRVGGSELRHSVVSWVVHNTPESIAALVVPGDVAKKAVRMEPGQAIFYSRGRTSVGWVPYASVEDAEEVARQYAPVQSQTTRYLDAPTPTTPLRLSPSPKTWEDDPRW